MQLSFTVKARWSDTHAQSNNIVGVSQIVERISSNRAERQLRIASPAQHSFVPMPLPDF